MRKIVLALLRFGALVTLASRAVLTGFATGAAIHIAVGQLKHLLRIDVPVAPELFLTATRIIRQLPTTHLPSLAIGLATVTALLLLRKFGPRGSSALGAIVLAGIAVADHLLDGGPLPHQAMRRSIPSFRCKRWLRRAFDLDFPNPVYDRILASPLLRQLARLVFFHHRGVMSREAWRDWLGGARTHEEGLGVRI